MISCVVLTRDEELDIERCLRSLEWCDDIHLVDSGSSDRTVQIARETGANVVINVPNGAFRHADQRNWALQNLVLKNDWVLFIDADEVCTTSFVKSISDSIDSAGSDINAFYCAPKFMYHGRWLRRTKSFPTWEPRLVKKGEVGFVPGTWERFDSRATPGYVNEPYEHFANSKGLTAWLGKHLVYAKWEAEEGGSGASASRARRLASRTGALRPIFVLFWYSLFRGGLFEGVEGRSYVRRMFIYELLIQESKAERKILRDSRPL